MQITDTQQPQLTCALFSGYLQSSIELVAEDNSRLQVVVESVVEVPAARITSTGTQRMPFSVVLAGPPGFQLVSGLYRLALGELVFQDVYINQIMNLSGQPGSRFQIVFN